ncbi:MAG: S8 family serine peptidase [Solirubrobacterales bacterium]|nr:S8 family serine peptidase [Solirubrobacterales bacterium]
MNLSRSSLAAGGTLLLVLSILGVNATPGPASGINRGTLDVRFTSSLTVRGEGTNLRAESPHAVDRLEHLLAEIDATDPEPLVLGTGQPAATSLARQARRETGGGSPNMADWYRITVPADSIDAAVATLRNSPLVTHAGRSPIPAPPPVTPDFTPLQRHLDLAPIGTGSRFALNDPRTRGAGVTVVSLEYFWNRDHEDLQLPESTDAGEGVYVPYTGFENGPARGHGTAVFGLLAARDNGFGVIGAVPDATVKGISPTTFDDFFYNPAGALTFLAGRLSPGDVVLVEQQIDGPGPTGTDYVPLEWDQASFDAIRLLTSLGVVVVEAGANGGHDLDGADMLGRFDRELRDSGAIIVGAGDPVSHAPIGSSSHGSRVDLQGHGAGIVTTGGDGNLQGASVGEENLSYTDSFGGTSGATPIVAGAVVALLSYLKATGQPPMPTAELVGLLQQTGTPQGSPELGRIGPLPDLNRALRDRIPNLAPGVTIRQPVDGARFGFNSEQTVGFSCDDEDSGIETCSATDHGPAGRVQLEDEDELPTDQPGSHTVTVTATDREGLSTTATARYVVAPGCFLTGVTLASIEPRGRRVRILGIADPFRAGERAYIFRNGSPAGSTEIRTDGSIVATAAAPGWARARARARYRLTVGGSRSGLKRADGRARLISLHTGSKAERIRFRVGGIRKRGRLTLTSRPLCGGKPKSQRVGYSRRGLFTVKLGRSPWPRVLTARIAGRNIPLPVVLPARPAQLP